MSTSPMHLRQVHRQDRRHDDRSRCEFGEGVLDDVVHIAVENHALLQVLLGKNKDLVHRFASVTINLSAVVRLDRLAELADEIGIGRLDTAPVRE